MCYTRALFPRLFSLQLSENKSSMWIICFLAPVILSVDSATSLFPVLVFHHFLQAEILRLHCPRWGGFTRWWCQSHSLLWGECLAFHGRCAGMAGNRASPPLTYWSFICINCFYDLLDFSGLFLLWAGSPGVKLEPVAAQEVQQECEAQQGKLPLWQQQLQDIPKSSSSELGTALYNLYGN